MINILVTGANGQLGSEFKAIASEFSNYKITFANRSTIDITDETKLRSFCVHHNFETIINCAAYTLVDKAEDENIIADNVNHKAVNSIATIAKELNIKLVHISTDYVFDGHTSLPYAEEDNTNPINIYGRSKLNGELSLINVAPQNSIIIRTSWVYSSYGNNFVKTMLKLSETKKELSVIFDQVGSPTYARDLAKHILQILPNINNDQVEIYHYTNEGVCSWYDFAHAVFEISKKHLEVTPIESSAYPTKATRPHYSVLNKHKIKSTFGIKIRHWREALKSCLSVIES